MKFYKVMYMHLLIYGSESWTKTPIHASEMKLIIYEYVWGFIKADKIRNEILRLDLNIFSINGR